GRQDDRHQRLRRRRQDDLMRALAEKIGPLEQIVTIEKERELHLDRLDSRLVPPIELQARPGSGERAADGSHHRGRQDDRHQRLRRRRQDDLMRALAEKIGPLEQIV
ncbi:hypothetical protein ACNQUF_12615, partial [Corynebacterium diphtheriae]